MKWLTLITLLIFVKLTSAQIPVEETNDSLKKEPFVSRLLFDDYNKRNKHILDVEVDPYIYLGYNYYYRLNPFLHIGGRVGLSTFKVASAYQFGDRIFPFRAEALLSCRIYKSICTELGVGYSTFYNYSIATGKSSCPPGTGLCDQDEGNIAIRLGINMTVFKHAFIRGGVTLKHSLEYRDFFTGLSLGLGYKF